MTTRTANASIGFDEIGSGQPIVFLHAFPLDSTMWAPQTSALADDFRCITIDTRGFGESTATPPFTIDRYADDVIAVLDLLDIETTTVVGLSMGGYIAFALWRRAPHRVNALVLADTRAGVDTPDTRQRRHELIALAHSEGPGAVVERQLVGLLGKSTRERQPDVEESVRAIAQSATVDGIVGALEAMLGRQDSVPTLATIKVPTLIVVGDEDVITPPKEARAMHAAIQESRLEVLAGAGHLSSLEQPAAFNALMREFVLS
ncbi:MAG: alpha/beta fold hydrolase [Gemmatimonadaceae bacterium]